MELLPQPAPDKKLDLKKELRRYLRRWPWFLASLALFLTGAYLYLRYTPKIYESRASVYVDQAKNRGSFSMADIQIAGLQGGIGNAAINDEIAMMKAKPLLEKVVKSLHLDAQFKAETNVKEVYLFADSPLQAEVLTLNDAKSFPGRSYTVKPNNSGSYLLISADGKERTFFYDVPVKEDFGTFRIRRVAGKPFKNNLQLTLLNPAAVTGGIEAALILGVQKERQGIIDMSMQSTLPGRSEAVMNELVRQYNLEAIRYKNQEAQNTANFIDDRLQLITQELGSIEGQKEQFKRSNRITDLETQAQLSVQNANEATRQIMDVSVQLEMVNSILKLANSANNEQLLPSNMGVPGAGDQLISEYNQLVLQRNRTLRQATSANPAVQQFDRDIAATRSLIKDNLMRTRATLRDNLAQLQSRVSESQEGVSRFPEQERMFRSIDRQQNIKEALYLYLLQKREETSISLAVTTPRARVVNPAYTAGVVAPKSKTVYGGAAAAGLLLPFLVFFAVFALDTKVHSKKDITETLPDLPVLTEVPTVEKDASDLVGQNDLSVYAEAYRILTTNLKFILNKPKGTAPVIIFSSSVKGEGKTTVSVNTAITLAATKKVVIIGADLRNPQLERYISTRHTGLADYLADPGITLEDVIIPSGLAPQLDAIRSGSIPPNPSDLLEDSRFDALLSELRARYDYIIIDSAPLMMVSDTHHILQYADALVYVIRADYSEKELLTYAAGISQEDSVRRMAFVLNDVRHSEMRYGYGGKYGYGYNYHSDTKKKPFWRK